MTNEIPLVTIDQYFVSTDSAIRFLSEPNEKKDSIKRIIAYLLLTGFFKPVNGQVGKSVIANNIAYNRLKETFSIIPLDPVDLIGNERTELIAKTFNEVSDYLREQNVPEGDISDMVKIGVQTFSFLQTKNFALSKGLCWQFMHIYSLILHFFRSLNFDMTFVHSHTFLLIVNLHLMQRSLESEIDGRTQQILKKIRPDIKFDESQGICASLFNDGMFSSKFRSNKLLLIWDYIISSTYQKSYMVASLFAHMISAASPENSTVDKNIFNQFSSDNCNCEGLVQKARLYIEGRNAYDALLVKISSFTLSVGFAIYLCRKHIKRLF